VVVDPVLNTGWKGIDGFQRQSWKCRQTAVFAGALIGCGFQDRKQQVGGEDAGEEDCDHDMSAFHRIKSSIHKFLFIS